MMVVSQNAWSRKWVIIAVMILLSSVCVLLWVQSIHARRLADLRAKGKNPVVVGYTENPDTARKALLSNPNDVNAHLGLSHFYMKHGDYRQALQQANAAAQAQPGNDEALYEQGHALVKSGQTAAGVKVWQQLAAHSSPWGLKARRKLYTVETNKQGAHSASGT